LNFITECFDNIIKKGAIPPSMLFTGDKESKKNDFAQNLAMALNCAENNGSRFKFCGKCRNCRRIRENIYPDFIIVETEGSTIKVEQIRELKAILSFKPYEAKKRIVLIKNASLLNLQSGNALLKMMEEPPLNTHFVLTAADSSGVLKTIRSRCQIFRFSKSFSEQEKKSFFSPESIKKEAEISQKDYELSRSLFHKLFMENFKNFNMIYLAGEALSGKKTAEAFCIYMLVFFRDLIVSQTSDDKIYSEEAKNLIAENNKKIDNKKLHEVIKIIYSAQTRLRGNVNTKILIKSSLLKIQAAINE